MPIVAKVDGVQIVFYANEHPPPHFHARFAEHQAVVDIARLEVIAGYLPSVKRRSVMKWASARQDALTGVFNRVLSHEKVGPIE